MDEEEKGSALQVVILVSDFSLFHPISLGLLPRFHPRVCFIAQRAPVVEPAPSMQSQVWSKALPERTSWPSQSTIEGNTRVRAVNFGSRRTSDKGEQSTVWKVLLYDQAAWASRCLSMGALQLHAFIVFIRSEEVVSKHAPAWPHKKLVAQWRIHDLYIRGAT